MIQDLGAHLRAVAAVDPDAPMLEFDGVWAPWSRLTGWMDDIGAALDTAGVGEGGAVGVVMRNQPESVGALAAVLGSGRCVVTLNPSRPDDRLAEEITTLGLGAVITGGEDLQRDSVMAAARQRGVSIEVHGPMVEPHGSPRADPPRRPGVAVEMLTSGTTGPPKRIPLTDARLLRSISGGVRAGPELRSGTKIVWAPLAHIGGLWGTVATLAEGRRLALMPKFEIAGWVRRVREHQPRVTGLPPTGMRMLLDADIAPDDLRSLRAVTIGTAPASPQLIEEFETTFGVPALITYGATEFAGAVALWTLDLHREYAIAKRGSVGRAIPGVDLRIVDADHGEPLPTDQVGLLEVRSEGLGDGWTRTTDRARLDADGFLYIVGRADDAIIRGGFKVSAGDVVAAIERVASVRRAGVVGLPDARLGEVPVAAVEVDDPAVDEATIMEALRGDLAAYQIPASIRVVEALPLTPTLKVDTVALRSLLAGPATGS